MIYKLRCKCGSFGRGGGDRKLNPLSQVLSCQRRSTAALLPIGVKWCQIPRTAHDRSVLAISTRGDWTLPVSRLIGSWLVVIQFSRSKTAFCYPFRGKKEFQPQRAAGAWTNYCYPPQGRKFFGGSIAGVRSLSETRRSQFL